MKNYNKMYDEPDFKTAEFIEDVEVQVEPEPTPEPTQEIGIVTAREVYIRKGPGKDYEHVGTVRKGEMLIVLERDNDFLYVETQDGIKAYIMESFVSID